MPFGYNNYRWSTKSLSRRTGFVPLCVVFSAILALVQCLVGTDVLHAQTEDVLRRSRPATMNRVPRSALSDGSSPAFTLWTVGFETGVSLHTLSRSAQTTLPAESSLNVWRRSSGSDIFWGTIVETNLADRLGLQVRLAYEEKSLNRTIEGADVCYNFDRLFEANMPKSRTRGEMSQKDFYLSLAPALRYQLNSSLGVHVGPLVQFRSGSSRPSILWVGEGTACSFFNEDALRPVREVPFVHSGAIQPIRFALDAGLSARKRLSETVSLIGTVRGQYFVTPYATDESFRSSFSLFYLGDYEVPGPQERASSNLHSLQVVVGLLWDLW